MVDLITKRDEYIHLTNDLTREMDSYLITRIKKTGFGKTYIYDHPFENKWLIRFPGATRGNIEVDNNMIITNITLYSGESHTDGIYENRVRECFDKYIGMRLFVIK